MDTSDGTSDGTSDDIRRRIDASFGDGPALAPVDLVPRGRRALARRRLVAGVGAVALLTGVGAAAAVVTRPAALDTGSRPQVAGAPSPAVSSPPPATPSPTAAPPTREEISAALSRPLAEVDGNGKLLVDPGATVLERIDDPYRGVAAGTSVALSLEFRGATYWVAMYQAPDGSGTGTAGWAGDQEATFAAWTRDQADLAGGAPTSVGPAVWPRVANVDLVRLVGGTEVLEPVDGARVLRQRAHVSVGDAWAAPGDQTAAAAVQAKDGRRYYVLARALDQKPGQYVAVRRSDGGPTLQAFLDQARQRYSQGTGGVQ